MERWVRKVAIVTGASSGIGAVIAKKLVEAGVLVAGFARRDDRVDKLAERLKDKSGKLFAVKVDVRQEEEIFRGFKWVKENMGAVNILINNAGVVRFTNMVDGNTEFWKVMLDTNVLGLSMMTREAARDMRENNVDGHIVNINSIVGHKVPNIPNFNVYMATKHAVTAITESLRQEFLSTNSKIKISSISPGAVNTEFPLTDEVLANLFKQIPCLEAEDVANAVMYVLGTPPHVQVHDIIIKPLGETF